MKKIIYSLLIICSSFYACNKKEKTNFVFNSPVPLADPFIMLHNNTYYAYGTNAENGIEAYTSDDLNSWKKADALALKSEDSYGGRWFWAPEVYYIAEKNKFFMYYTADEHICVATADSPLGPFKQDAKVSMFPNEKSIDNGLFVDNGKPYMYFVRFNDGLNVWVAELENDYKTIKIATLRKCINVSQTWEQVQGRVNEGPYVVKHNNLYYMTYSGNHFESQSYGIGVATATSPNGTWTKYATNPILQKPLDLVGVGHSAMFTDKAGKMRIVFHAHHSTTSVNPRAMYIADVSFTNDSTPIMQISNNIIRTKIQRK